MDFLKLHLIIVILGPPMAKCHHPPPSPPLATPLPHVDATKAKPTVRAQVCVCVCVQGH